MKMSALFHLQLLKLKKIKCLYFLGQTSFEEDISSLSFCDFMKIPETPFTSHKMSKSSYLPQMMSDPKNKGILFSSTLIVEEGKVHSFLWSEFILVSYVSFVVSLRYRKTPQKSQNNKKLIYPSNNVKLKALYFLQL